ncbi:MAG: enoyl-CoA hydratase/isomerase family protein [Dehalococcoidia bacterium]
MSPSAAPPVLYEKSEPGVAWITLNRPHALNAINLAMRDELWTYLQAAQVDPDVRVLCFRGASPRAFSAGADVTEFGTAPSILAARRARHERDLWALLEDFPVITIAALHGFCFGAGIELPLYCDFRIAAPDTLIALPEVTLGYIPSAGGTQMLPRLAPPGVALGLILSGDQIDAPRALAWGLINRIVPRDELDDAVSTLARRLAGRDVETMRLAKRALRRGLDLPLDDAIALDAAAARRHRALTPSAPRD